MSSPPRDDRRYRVLAALGSGGFGSVYLAEQLDGAGLRRRVALKVMQDGDLAEQRLARLRDEARMLARIHHRALVPVYGLVQLDAGWTIVLEWVDGADLSVVLSGGPVPPRVVAEVVAEVADALVAAWDAPAEDGQPLQLLHRDLKPQNIRLTVHGDVRVLDLGAARGNLPGREAHTSRYMLGTPAYMPPERMLEGIEGPAGDVWSLGLVAVDLLRGHLRPARGLERSARDALLDRVATDLERTWLEAPEAWRAALHTLVDDMTRWEHGERPTMREVRDRAARLADQAPGPRCREWVAGRVRQVQATLPPPDPEDPWVGRELAPVARVAPDPPPLPEPSPGPSPSPGLRPVPWWRAAAAVSVAATGLAAALWWGRPVVSGGASAGEAATSGPAASTPSPGPVVGAPSPAPVVATPSPAPIVATPSPLGTTSPSPSAAIRPPPTKIATPAPRTPPVEAPTLPAPATPPPAARVEVPAAAPRVRVALEDSPYPSLMARPVAGGDAGSVPGTLAAGTYKLFAGDSYKGTVTVGPAGTAVVHCSVGQQRKCATR